MKEHIRLCILLTLVLVITTGCWDRTELNDLALVLGWGMDLKDDGTYLGTAQIAIPSQAQSGSQNGGGEGNAFFTESASGKDETDAGANLQAKLSRKVSAGHRKEIFFGEKLAIHGLAGILDEFSRNPDVRLRTDAFVVKGGTAEEILKIPQPLEKLPALAGLKLHQQIGGIGDVELANFLIDALTRGNSPTLPVMEIVQSQAAEATGGAGFIYAGRAIFNQKLKLIGYLDTAESNLTFWIKGRLKFLTLTDFISAGNGTVSLDLEKLGARIRPSLQGNKIKITVILWGNGLIRENNTQLNLFKARSLYLIQDAFDKQCEKQVNQLVTKLQKKYKADIFGMGQSIHRKYPTQWKSLKKNWDEEFSKANVVVKVNLRVKNVGLTNTSLLHEKFITK